MCNGYQVVTNHEENGILLTIILYLGQFYNKWDVEGVILLVLAAAFFVAFHKT